MERYWVWEYGPFEKNPKRVDSLNPETTSEVVKLADAQATVEALQAVIRQMGEQAARLAKDGMAAKAQVEALQAQLKTARYDAVRAFVRGEDKMCFVCGAKEPCELKDDPSSPCTFDPTPMELKQQVEALQARVQELEARQHFGACAKCLTNAWRICKESTPDAVEMKCSNGSTWWLCDYCLSKEQLTQRTAEVEALQRVRDEAYKQGFADALEKVASDWASKEFRGHDEIQGVEVQAFLDSRHVHYEECRGVKPLQAALDAERDRLRAALEVAGDDICSEFCGSGPCHKKCLAVKAALTPAGGA